MAAMKNLRTDSSKGSCSANCSLPLPPGTSWSQIFILAADYSNANSPNSGVEWPDLVLISCVWQVHVMSQSNMT